MLKCFYESIFSIENVINDCLLFFVMNKKTDN